jgi:hypothetical protein
VRNKQKFEIKVKKNYIFLLEKFERIKEDKESMERLENGVEDRARCLWQEYQHIKGISTNCMMPISLFFESGR